MVPLKMSIALFALAAGGFMNGEQLPPDAPTSMAPATESTHAQGDASPQALALVSLQSRVRADLHDPGAQVDLKSLAFAPVDSRTWQGTGVGEVRFDQAGVMPIAVTVSYDQLDGRIVHLDYTVTGDARPSARQALGHAMRERIADRIGARLVLEFAGQPVDFRLLEINKLTSGRYRMVISGNGITAFAGESAAYTRFVATADKFSGKVLTVQYELLQEVPASPRQVASN